MIFGDTETCGLTGPIVLIQYADLNFKQLANPNLQIRDHVQIEHIWLQPISRTLLLLEKLTNSEIVFFNLAYDWFHIIKLYNLFRNFVETFPYYKDDHPIFHIQQLYEMSSNNNFEKEYCLKPKACLDIWLHALTGPWQQTMERKDIVIRNVPNEVVDDLIEVLNQIDFVSPILFAKSSIPIGGKLGKVNWKAKKSEKGDGNRFKDITLKFKASSALKAFAKRGNVCVSQMQMGREIRSTLCSGW
jgi:hypothetical protein